MNIASAPGVIRIGQIEIRPLREGADTNGALAVLESTIPPYVRMPAPHHHVTYDQTVYAIVGMCTAFKPSDFE